MAVRWLIGVFFVVVLFSSHSLAAFNVTDDTYFEIKWPGESGSVPTPVIKTASSVEEEEEDKAAASMLVKTPDGRSTYHCRLPSRVHNQKYRKPFTDYAGVGPLELLQPLFEQKACSFKIESYWTYELCHGKHLRQYHEEIEADKSTKKLEFYLGYYKGAQPAPVPAPPTAAIKNTKKETAKEQSQPDAPAKPKVEPPPTVNLEGTNFPYFQVNFTDGTVCDLTKKPREVALLYICLESGRGEIYELVEVESCSYRIVVMTKLLCQHPAYVVSRPHVNSIHCRPADPKSPPKPAALQQHEQQQLSAVERGRASSLEGLFGADLKVEATREKDRVLIRIASKASESEQAKEQPPPPPPSEPPAGLLRKFVSGKDCVVGGSGWWRHELCFGSTVTQFHDDAQTEKRTTLTLGRWDQAAHLIWIAKNKRARPVKDEMLTHFYGGGDRCEETKRARQVEVRLRCLKNAAASPSAMSIMLQEPALCQYILTVEGVALCSLINQADENGLLPETIQLD